MNNPEQEETVLHNETPKIIVGTVSKALSFLQQYGWFILIALIAMLYIKKRFIEPKLDRWLQQREDASYKKMDTGVAQSQLEAMEKARQRMQEQLDQQAAVYKLRQQEKEEKSRQEKIADWQRHQEGRGYRNKFRPKEDSDAGQSPPRPKPKRPLRDPDYNPLMGNASGSAFRPPRRGPTGGG